MSLQKRSAAPGKARRAASKGKPRKAAAAKATKRAVAQKSSPRKGTSATKETRRFTDREEGTISRKQQRNSDRSKIRAKRFQEKTASKSKNIEGAVKGSPRQSSEERVFSKARKKAAPSSRTERREYKPREEKREYKPRTEKREYKPREEKREYKPRTESREYKARTFDKPRSEKPRSFDKPRSKKPMRDRRNSNAAVDFGAEDNYISAAMTDANLIDATPNQSTGTTFRALGVAPAIDNALSAQGITEPFPIQAATLPDALAGHDILGRGQTGSGKTLAFSLALLTRIHNKAARPHHPLAIILTPTRELAQQIDEVLRPLARSIGHQCVVVAGGMAYGKQINAMRSGTAIIVATPGRLIDLLNKGEVILDEMEIAVLDEADQMADMGFLPVVSEILDQAKSDGQRLLFSATLDRGVDALVKKYLKNPRTHALQNDRASVDTMEHFAFICDPSEKEEITAEIAARHGKTILFVKTQRGADRVADKLASVGVPAAALHGGKSQAVRTRTLALFKEQPDAVLVATDVAARGIHVDGISLVVHVDPPQDHKDYLHRSGRTARAGESGKVLSIITQRQLRAFKGLVARAGVSPETIKVTRMDENVVEIVGAREPSGIPYVPPVSEAPKSPKRRNYGGKGGGRGYGRRPRK